MYYRSSVQHHNNFKYVILELKFYSAVVLFGHIFHAGYPQSMIRISAGLCSIRYSKQYATVLADRISKNIIPDIMGICKLFLFQYNGNKNWESMYDSL